MHRAILIALTPSAIVLSACALPSALPSFEATAPASRAPAPPASAVARLPARVSVGQGAPLVTETDSATHQGRVSLTTHRGKYFLWIQHPRVTFFYVYEGAAAAHPPASIYLVFRTHDPQAPSSNRLTLVCDGAEHPQAVEPTFAFEQGPMTSSRVFTYELSLETFATFTMCDHAAVRVGDITATFDADRITQLRAFAGGMPVGVGGGD
jgi:hypothetical protein